MEDDVAANMADYDMSIIWMILMTGYGDVDDDVTTSVHLLLGHLRRGPLSWAKILTGH
jgi:hypothetical protein